jgi:hypothetical protein
VVLAVPAAPAARLLAPFTPTAAAELAAVEHASVAIVTLVLDGPLPGAQGSGYLVPAVEGGRPRRSPSPPASGRTSQGSAPCCGPASAGPARPPTCSAATTSWSRWCWPSWRRPSDRCPGSWTRGSSAGAAGCRSTPSGTSTWSAGCAREWPGGRGSRWPERPTTGSASRPAPGPGARQRGPCSGRMAT